MDDPNQYVFPALEIGKDRPQGKHRPLSQVERKERSIKGLRGTGWRQSIIHYQGPGFHLYHFQNKQRTATGEEKVLTTGFTMQAPITKVQLGFLLPVQSKDHIAF